MHHPRLFFGLLLSALTPALAVAAPRAAEPLVAVSRAVPAPALLARDQPLGRQAADAPVSVALTLPLRSQPQLQDLLKHLYTPGDPLFGHYLTPAQFTAQFGPSEADYQAVVSAMQAQGLTVRVHRSRSIVGVSGASAAIEKAFRVQLNQYRTPHGRVAYANSAAPLLPAALAARISGIVGLDNLILPHPLYTRRPAESVLLRPYAIGTDASGGLTPTDIKKIYNLSGVGLQGEGQSMALAELGGYNTSDIRAYIQKYNLPIDPNNASILTNIYTGGFNGAVGATQGEVVLDIDMMLALTPRASHIYVYESPGDPANNLQLFQQIADDHFVQTISYSYGQAEDVEAAQFGGGYSTFLDAENAEFQQMAAEGITVCVASGDNGAYTDLLRQSVSDPATQPFVTAVGGTTLHLGNPGTTNLAYASESAWGAAVGVPGVIGGVGGGGGFSDYFAKPFYQYASQSLSNPVGAVGASAGVGAILATSALTLPTTPKRDLPDVSLDADPHTGYAVYVGADGDTYPNGFEVDGGTSASAPLWAAFVALVNEARAAGSTNVTPGLNPGLAATPVGFLNPLIYEIGFGLLDSYPNDFHDVLDGSSNQLFEATPGFDDATGWGSFNGANLLGDLALISPGAVPGSGGGPIIGTTTTASGVSVTGAVTFDGAAPVGGITATVTAVSSDGSQRTSVTTDSTGHYTLTLPSGLTYNFTATANAYIGQSQPGIAVGTGGATVNFALTDLVTANITPFPPGYQMVSEPFDFSATGLDFAGLFGLTVPIAAGGPALYLWQSQAGAYASYPNAPADTLRPGVGYWLYVPISDTSGLSLRVGGRQATSPFVLPLQKGWNQIGDPFVANESLSNVTVSLNSGGVGAASLPNAAGLVSPVLYSYPAGSSQYSPETATLQPYRGYWIYAFQPVSLTFN